MAKCRNKADIKDGMAVVGERHCRSPTGTEAWQDPDGGRQAIATCHERGQADHSHDGLRAQGRYVQVPVRQIQHVSKL